MNEIHGYGEYVNSSLNRLGQIKKYTLAIGSKIKWMEKDYSNGQMVASMKEISTMTKSMDKALSNGEMVANIVGNGRSVNNMD